MCFSLQSETSHFIIMSPERCTCIVASLMYGEMLLLYTAATRNKVSKVFQDATCMVRKADLIGKIESNNCFNSGLLKYSSFAALVPVMEAQKLLKCCHLFVSLHTFAQLPVQWTTSYAKAPFLKCPKPAKFSVPFNVRCHSGEPGGHAPLRIVMTRLEIKVQ